MYPETSNKLLCEHAMFCRRSVKNSMSIIAVIAVASFVLKAIYFGFMVKESNAVSEQGENVPLLKQVCTGNPDLCSRLDSVFLKMQRPRFFPNGNKIIPPLFDFDLQPCVAGLTPSAVLRSHGECVRTLKRRTSDLEGRHDCVNLTTPDLVTPICVYKESVDQYISVYIRKTGTWEELLLLNIVRLLKVYNNAILLDLGCNVGAFTLAAAKSHAHVVAVDPLLTNLALLSKSLYLGNLTQNVTLVWNAVTSNYSTVTLQKYAGNVGGTAIKFGPSRQEYIWESVNTIKLDDLLEFFIEKPTIIKMDIETQEMNALLGGKLFFQTIDVRVVLMEYNWHKKRHSGIEIITFMENYGFRPFEDSRGHMPLYIESRRQWPGEVFFLKQENFQDFLQTVK